MNSMYARLDRINDWLDAYGVTQNTNYDVMLRRIAGTDDISALRTLVDVVEPVKGYSRPHLAATEPTALTPLNRVVDAARPESATARRFSALVDAFISAKQIRQTEPQIRALLVRMERQSGQASAAGGKLGAGAGSFSGVAEPLSPGRGRIAGAGLSRSRRKEAPRTGRRSSL